MKNSRLYLWGLAFIGELRNVIQFENDRVLLRFEHLHWAV